METGGISEGGIHILVALISCGLFLYISGILSVFVSKRWLPHHYNGMSEKDKWTWRATFGSIVNAIFLSTCSAYILLTEKLTADVFWTDSLSSRLLSSFEIGYFISDSIFLCWYDMQKRKLQYLAHHVFGVIGLGMTVIYKVFAFHTCLRFIQDFSTPFMHLRWALFTWKLKDSRAYLVNGLIFVIAYFFCRIYTMPLYYTKFLEGVRSGGYSRLPMTCKIIYVSISTLLDILNVYWFVLIVKGCLKILIVKKKDA